MSKTQQHDTLQIFTDGGSRGNPGPSGIGAVLFDKNGEKVGEISKYIGIATNNVAEYLAVIYGLEEAIFLKAKNVIITVDSQLVAKQLNGEYKVREENMKKFFDLTVNLFRMFDKVEVNEVSRDKNKDADALVNKAINLQALL